MILMRQQRCCKRSSTQYNEREQFVKQISFYKSLSGRILLFAIVPVIVVLTSILAYMAINSFAETRQNAEKELKQLAVEVAKEVEIGNTRAVLAAQLMAFAQESALFGHRAESSEFARRVLEEYPELTGAYIGYEPNADTNDAAFLTSLKDPALKKGLDSSGRFLPYWFRDKQDHNKLLLVPLIDMETSLYYQGVHDLFDKAGKPLPMVTEPYVYEGKMIVEQTYPILRNGRFVGIAGVDRALDDMDSFLHRIKEREAVDLFLISSAGRFIAATDQEAQLKTKAITDTPYKQVFGDFHKHHNVQSLSLASDPFSNSNQYYVSAPIATGEWMIVLRHSEDVVSGPIKAKYYRMGLLAAAGIMLVLILAMRFTNTTARRIKKAMDAADMLAAGELSVELPSDDEGDEVGRMHLSFNSVLDSYRRINDVMIAIAGGDFSQRMEKRSDKDTLAEAVNVMAARRRQAEEEMARAQLLAEESTRSKGDFLANMSHEIRTPMNGIIGMSHLALQTELTKKQRNYITKAHRSAESLLNIINDILDFSKIEAGKLDIEKIDFRLEDAFDSLAHMIGLNAEEKGLELMFDIPPELPTALIGDPLRLGQILTNLGNNAVKFTEKGEVVFAAEVVEQDDEQCTLHFSVRDTGVGISPEQQKKLFQSFTQADTSTTRKFGGTGLGLTISKTLTEMMGGEIWLESKEGEGSTFHFTVQLGKQQGESSKRRSSATELGAFRVLVVDDNSSSREILSSMLASFGLRVDQAGSGESAIAQLEQANDYDAYKLVLMDWKMPGMSGIETTRAIQSDNNLTETPTVIMVTAYGREEASHAAEGVNIQGFLTKPVTSSTLLDTIMLVMGHEVASENNGSKGLDPVSEFIAKLRGAKVLLVEDNEINQELALELLVSNGITAEVANNGQEALDILEREEFDGVLMDCQMPVMDGYEATQRLRKNDKYQKLPILALSANAMVGDRQKVLDAGMNDHIAKPINVNELFSTMAKWISPSRPVTESIPELVPARAEVAQGGKEGLVVPELDGIDTVSGLARTQNNHKLYLKLLRKVGKSQANFIEEFDAAVNTADWELAQRLAHSLKGVAGNIGAQAIEAACKTLEAEAKEQRSCDPSREVARLALERVLVSIASLDKTSQKNEEVSPESGNITEVAVDKEKLTDLIQQLAAMIADYDTGAQELIETEEPLLIAAGLAAEVKQLSKALEDYDFETAAEVVKEIAETDAIKF
jgi:signal transduction histidine kinase/CheY-like chemotaxis protein